MCIVVETGRVEEVANKEELRIEKDELLAFSLRVLQMAGMPRDDARIAAAILVDTDMRGVRTHGSMLLPNYAKRLQTGVVNPRPSTRIVRDGPAMALLDGDNGMGHVIARGAMELATSKARESGIGIVGVVNSNHFGAAGYYARMAVEVDCLGIAATIGSNNAMAPWGGREAVLGNNPIAIAAPAGSTPPPVLDFANSVVARAKIILAAKTGEPIPLGWVLDPEGRPTMDAAAGLQGTVLPMAEHKGAGFAYMLGILCGILTGAAFGRSVKDQFTDFVNPQNIGHAMIAIDVSYFRAVAEFKAELDRVSEEIRHSAPAPGHDRVYLPGDRSQKNREDADKNGIPMSPAVFEELCALAAGMGVTALSVVDASGEAGS